MSAGWRQNFADVIVAIKGTLADASNAGSISAAEFLKIADLPILAGGGISKNVTAGVGTQINSLLQMVATPEIDLLTLNAQQSFDFSGVPAYLSGSSAKGLITSLFLEVTQQTGVVAGSAVLSLFLGASPASFTGLVTLTAAQANALAVTYSPGLAGAGFSRVTMPMSSLVAGPLSGKVTTAATGATVLKARLCALLYIDTPGILP